MIFLLVWCISAFNTLFWCSSNRRPLFAQPAAALWWRLGHNRAATAAPIERSKGKQSYDILRQIKKVGMPFLSLLQAGESRRAPMERSIAIETPDTGKTLKVGELWPVKIFGSFDPKRTNR